LTASTRIPEITSWQDVPWPQVEANVHALQRRIYRAEQQGKRRVVKSLQRLLLRSTSARLLAVRRVTQDNQGKRTPGVDGLASLEPEERCQLVRTLSLAEPARPVRRIWIPKPGTQEQRPLGIPMVRAYCTPYQKPWGSNSCRLPGAALVHALLVASSPARQHTSGRSFRRPLFPATPHRFPQALNALRCQPDPPRPVRRGLNAIQATRLAPFGDGGHRHV
jgi:reverse transcriptase-like protein